MALDPPLGTAFIIRMHLERKHAVHETFSRAALITIRKSAGRLACSPVLCVAPGQFPAVLATLRALRMPRVRPTPRMAGRSATIEAVRRHKARLRNRRRPRRLAVGPGHRVRQAVGQGQLVPVPASRHGFLQNCRAPVSEGTAHIDKKARSRMISVAA